MGASANNDDRNANLWQRFADLARGQESAVGVDACLLAAYLDGLATPDEVKMVEHAMTSEPTLIEAVSELRELQRAEPVDVPDNVIARVKAALATMNRDESPEVGSITEQRQSRLLVWLQQAAAAAAVVAMSFLGYQLGHDASRARSRTNADLASAVTIELYQEEYDLLGMFDARTANIGDQE